MSVGQKTTFKGYAIHDTKKWDEFKVIDYPSKTMEDYDVEIKINVCGVCGSDVHTITGGWGEAQLPLVTGHEIAGVVTAVGPKVTEFKVGDRAGVGAQIWSCQKCNRCKNDNENYCPEQVDTYNSKYPHLDEETQGGYSNGIRAHEAFTFPIPDGIEDKYAASMFCGGLTVYSPLVRYGTGPGKKIGIIGMGGLGHYAVMFAAALGADVTVFSSSMNKKADAERFGAKHFIDYSKEGWTKEAGKDFDFILSTRDVAEGFPVADFLSILNVNAQFNTVGLPDNPFPAFPGFAFASNGCSFGATHIGSKKEVIAMLKLAADKGLKPDIEEYPMKDAKIAVNRVKKNEVRYRAVLIQDLDA